MAYLELDKVTRAGIQAGPGKIRCFRRGTIHNLNTGLSAGAIFAEAMNVAGMPQYNDPYQHADFNFCKLRHRYLDTVDGNSHKATVLLVYESPDGMGLGPDTFVLQRSTTVVRDERERHPGTGTVMKNVWVHPSDPSLRVPRNAAIPYFRPFRRLIATGFFNDGPPPAEMLDALGSVNDAVWRGAPKGFWLYADQSDVTRDYGDTFSFTAELWNRMTEDWSEYDFIRDEHGRYLDIADADLTALAAMPYAYDVKKKNGVLKVGMYPLAPFGTTFGFGDIGMPL